MLHAFLFTKPYPSLLQTNSYNRLCRRILRDTMSQNTLCVYLALFFNVWISSWIPYLPYDGRQRVGLLLTKTRHSFPEHKRVTEYSSERTHQWHSFYVTTFYLLWYKLVIEQTDHHLMVSPWTLETSKALQMRCRPFESRNLRVIGVIQCNTHFSSVML